MWNWHQSKIWNARISRNNAFGLHIQKVLIQNLYFWSAVRNLQFAKTNQQKVERTLKVNDEIEGRTKKFSLLMLQVVPFIAIYLILVSTKCLIFFSTKMKGKPIGCCLLPMYIHWKVFFSISIGVFDCICFPVFWSTMIEFISGSTNKKIVFFFKNLEKWYMYYINVCILRYSSFIVNKISYFLTQNKLLFEDKKGFKSCGNTYIRLLDYI